MTKQASPITEECPVCGRPVRIRRDPGPSAAPHVEGADCPRVLLVEHRDEVFARLAADLAEEGFRVIRSTTGSGAIRHHVEHPFTIVVANLDLPDQSGWLLAAKLRLVDPPAYLWLYDAHPSPHHGNMAEHLKIDELLAYGGDLLRLSGAVVGRLSQTPRDQPVSTGRAASTPPAGPRPRTAPLGGALSPGGARVTMPGKRPPAPEARTGGAEPPKGNHFEPRRNRGRRAS